MSAENVERVRLWIEASRRRDWATVLSVYAETVVLDQTRMPDGGVYHGRAGVIEFFAQWYGTWKEVDIQPEQIIDVRKKDVLLVLRVTGTGRESGIAVSIRVADLMTLEDGEIVRQVGYPDATEALADFGLAE